MLANIAVRNCLVQGFSRDGIHIKARVADKENPRRFGNANSWQINNV
jgi:hypothetical protein